MAVPILAELIVGGFMIEVPSFWRDEGYTITGSQRPVGAIFSLVQHQDAFHGLYLLMMHPVIALFGRSEFALRIPSLIAMALAAGLIAALGRRLAVATRLPAPQAVGLLAGLLMVVLPQTTRYAQEGRPYALTVLFAVLTTYLLTVAVERGSWRWWALYSASLLVTGLLDLAALLLAGTHGISLLLALRHRRAGAAAGADTGAGSGADTDDRALSPAVLKRWLAACVAAAVVMSPILVFSARQSSQLDWVQPPNLQSLVGLLQGFAGSTPLVAVSVLLGLLGLAGAAGLRRGGGLTLPVVCLPWFFLPPVLVMTVSLVHPFYVFRYILFSLPGLVILEAAGLVWLVTLTRRFVARRWPERQADRWALIPSAVLAVIIVAALAAPQVGIRQNSSRADDLRTVSAILAAHEQPGDAILYLPRLTAVIGRAYPDPFDKLRDIGERTGPVASGTLLGTPASPKVVADRLHSVHRLWIVEWVHPLSASSVPPPNLVRLLAPLHMAGSWLVQSVLLILYVAPGH
ncbi:MAG TPA: glycosyltransferase family 39 protein [Streptosporangiaceae bacterium]